MRLPMNEGKIDIEQAKQMVDMFMDAGFTYFDTAWAYAGSEDAIRRALVERYPREKFKLATKNAAWIKCQTRSDATAQLDTSLKQTGAGYFDYYLLHNLGESRTAYFDKFGLWNWVLEKKNEGLIKHIGFSFHSTPEELDEILTNHPEMEFVQLQINYADWENPAIRSCECYNIARKHNKPVIVMEPVKGGMLAKPPKNVAEILKAAELDKIPLIPCTSCNYCAKVCPNNIGISGSFTAMNYYTLYSDKAAAKHQEDWLVGGHGKKIASECIKCGKCEKVCPQHILIRAELDKVSAALT